MKKFWLVWIVVLSASSASAGGIYSNSTATSAGTGAANTPTTLWSTNIPGTGVSSENAMIVHALTSSSPTQTGDIKIKLNGVQLTQVSVSDEPIEIDLRITRPAISSTAAYVTGTLTYSGTSFVVVPIPLQYFVVGLGWGSQQALTIIGQSNEGGGIHLEYAGVQR